MKNFIILLLAVGMAGSAFAQKKYAFSVNINDVADDKVMVTLTPPKLKDKKLTYHIPKIVPGTYSVYDFGRFVTDFKAVDKKGKELPVSHPDANTWIRRPIK